MSAGSSTRAEEAGPALRVAVLWSELSGYFRANLGALIERGAEVVVFHRRLSTDAPFDAATLTGGLATYEWSEAPDEGLIERVLAEFQPDVLMVTSWNVGAYRRVARRWRGRALRVLCMDNQWWGTPKQWAGVAASRWVIRPTYDAVFLPGERQAEFARRLGFSSEEMIWGIYTADRERFEQVAVDRDGALPPRAFLFVGRLVPAKAVDVMVEAYRRYRATVGDPWPLLVAGTGPQADLLEGVEGVEALGFVQPADMPAVFARAGCLVLPSRYEPWGVVVHEAVCAQLPVVCTWVCGAATRLVLDDYNGVVMSPDDPAALVGAFARVSEADDEQRRRMGQGSGLLAQQYSPARWADTFLRRVSVLKVDAGLSAKDGLTSGNR